MNGLIIRTLALIFLVSPVMASNEEVSLSFAIDEQKQIWQVNASMHIQMTPEQFVSLLDEGPINCSWLFNCKKVTLLHPPEDNVRFIATRLDSPWPFSDRIMYTKSTINYGDNKNDVLITITALPTEQIKNIPDDTVMISNPNGRWQLTKDKKDYRLDYHGEADIDPSIPKFLLRRQIEKSTLSTFENIRKLYE